MNNKGNASIEACIVVPVAVLFITAMIIINIRFYKITEKTLESDYTERSDYAEISRALRVIFETGGDIYDYFFG